jgi:hypothetical protein
MTDDILADGARLLDTMERSEFARAQARIATAPLDLTARDLRLLKTYGGAPLETQAYEARRLAQLEIVRSCGGHQDPSLQTKAAPAALPPDDSLTWTEYVAKHGHKTMTFACAAGMVDVLMERMAAMNEKNVERNKRLDALENRVLELEAQRSAVGHVESR